MRLKRKVRNTLIILLVFFGCLLIGLFGIYEYQISPVSDSSEKVTLEIPTGTSTKEIGKLLKESGLIRNQDFFVLYVKLNGKSSLKASTYEFSPNMGLEKIVNALVEGNHYNPDNVTITFKEGMNIRQIAILISENTNHTYEEFMAKMTDMEYIDALIDQYWFLTDEIKNEAIYYPLEGYLFPNTYQFQNKDVMIEEIIKTMLDEMDDVLTQDKAKIEKSNFTIHQLLTLASVVELEGVGEEDRDMIAQVFYNRLESGWSLGSDVTACYAFQVDIKNCNDNVDYNKYNPYNTRSSQMAGKLPIGPICNPSLNSILGSISPKDHDYFYFVADKYKKVYFTKTEKEHLAIIQEIKNKGEWPW